MINYPQLLDEAMLDLVKKALGFIKHDQVPGEHHFYITFLTNYPEVSLSDRLRAQYNESMTIVLQHQFSNFKLEENSFSVSLAFNDVEESITVPFLAITSFVDPSVKFGLQFNKTNQVKIEEKPADKESKKKNNNVVSLDSFRKK